MLDPQPTDVEQRCRRKTDGNADTDEIDRLLALTPQREVAERIERSDVLTDRSPQLPTAHRPADGRCEPSGEVDSVGMNGDGDHGQTDARTEGCARRRPCRRSTRHALRGEETSDAPDEGAAAHHGPETLQERLAQDGASGHRRQEEMAGVGTLDRERPALGTAAQSDRDGDGQHDTQVRRALSEKSLQTTVAERCVTDVTAHGDDRPAPEERCEIHVVGDVEPLGVAQAAAAPRSAEI
jgi:hypothetical protein